MKRVASGFSHSICLWFTNFACIVGLLSVAWSGVVSAQSVGEAVYDERIKAFRDALITASAEVLSNTLRQQATELASYSAYLLAAAKAADEKGIAGMYFAASVNSAQLRLAAERLSRSSNQLYNYSQSANLMSQGVADQASRVATFARAIPLVMAAVDTAVDSWSLFSDTREIQAKYPSLPVKATRLEYAATVFDGVIGLIPYSAVVKAALTPENTAYEEGDLIPASAADAKKWIAKMLQSAKWYEAHGGFLSGWQRGTVAPPPGLLQFLKANDRLVSTELGNSSLVWTRNWRIDLGRRTETGTYPDAKAVWSGPTAGNAGTTAISILASNSALPAGGTLTVVAEVSAKTSTSPALEIRSSSGQVVNISTFQTRVSAASVLPERWQYQSSNITLLQGNYQIVVRVTDASGKQVESAPKALLAEPPTGIPTTGQMTSPSTVSLPVNGTLRIAGTSKGRDPVVVQITFAEPVTGRQITENATRNAATGDWVLEKKMTIVGRYPYAVTVVANGGNSRIGQGEVTVNQDYSPPPITLNIQTVVVSPSSIQINQQMTFTAQVDNGAAVDRVELYFPEVNLTEAMTSTVANTWARTRQMLQAGTGKPFEVRVYQKSSSNVLKRAGTYTVQPLVATPRNEAPASVDCPVRGAGWTMANNSPLHRAGAGVGGADDSFALDLNLNTPRHDSDAGQPVYAAADGDVYTGNGWGGNSVGQLLINHTETDGRRWSTGYLHMTGKSGAKSVRRGDQIGSISSVGADNNHLHFVVYQGHNGVVSVNRSPSCNTGGDVPPVGGMTFVSETVSDNTLIVAARAFAKTWTLKNTGTTTWNSAYCLRAISGDALGSGQVCVQGSVVPGANYTFSAPMTSPAAKPAEAVYKQNWGLFNASTQIGQNIWVRIKVPASASGPAIPTGSTSHSPTVVTLGQVVNFKAVLSRNDGVAKVELVLTDINAPAEPMTQTSASEWLRARSFTVAGVNRPYSIRVTMADGRSQVVATGTYGVTTGDISPPPITLNIQTVVASPSSIQINQQMTFTAQVDNGAAVDRVELYFPEVNLTEAMTSTVANTWARTRQMLQAGTGKPFEVRVYQKSSSNVLKRAGTYTVLAAPPPPPLRDSMQFVSETLRDDSYVAASSATAKSWTLQNNGTSTWTSSYCLRPQGAQPLGSASACVSGSVIPGASYTFSMNLMVPTALNNVQTVRQNWALMNGSGVQVGATVWAQVRVAAVAPPPVAPPTGRISNSANQTVTTGGTVNLNGMVSGSGAITVRITYASGGVEIASVNSSSGTWAYSRVMNNAGQFPFTVTAHVANSSTQIGNGMFTVNPPAPPAVTLNVTGFGASPTVVLKNQQITFSVTVDNPSAVGSVELVFPDARNSEFLTRNGGNSNTWSKTRTMSTVGTNRPYEIKVRQIGGSILTNDGTFTVR